MNYRPAWRVHRPPADGVLLMASLLKQAWKKDKAKCPQSSFHVAYDKLGLERQRFKPDCLRRFEVASQAAG
jgi:hypothetical protein